ncbi:hypothetical protein SB748_32545, partial [Rhizobium sp. SIMBA_035]
ESLSTSPSPSLDGGHHAGARPPAHGAAAAVVCPRKLSQQGNRTPLAIIYRPAIFILIFRADVPLVGGWKCQVML